MLPGRWAPASVHHCPRFSIKEYIVPPRAHTPRPLVACCCPHRAGARAPSFSTSSLQRLWELEERAPCRSPGRVGQPHAQLHPRNSPMGLTTQQGSCTGTRWAAFPGWSPTPGRSHRPQKPCGVGGAADRASRSPMSAALLRGSWSAWPEGEWSESSTWPTARAATGLTVLLPGHLPSPHTAQTSLLAPSAPWRPNWEFSLCCAKAVRGARQGLPLTCHRDRSDLFILV